MQTKKCPVCDWEIKDKGKQVKAGNKNFTVCCDQCAEEVKKNPAKYAKK